MSMRHYITAGFILILGGFALTFAEYEVNPDALFFGPPDTIGWAAVVLFRPAIERRPFTSAFPAIVIGSAIVANWLIFQTPYVKPLLCINCQVAGKSAVASASVGVALVASVGTRPSC